MFFFFVVRCGRGKRVFDVKKRNPERERERECIHVYFFWFSDEWCFCREKLELPKRGLSERKRVL